MKHLSAFESAGHVRLFSVAKWPEAPLTLEGLPVQTRRGPFEFAKWSAEIAQLFPHMAFDQAHGASGEPELIGPPRGVMDPVPVKTARKAWAAVEGKMGPAEESVQIVVRPANMDRFARSAGLDPTRHWHFAIAAGAEKVLDIPGMQVSGIHLVFKDDKLQHHFLSIFFVEDDWIMLGHEEDHDTTVYRCDGMEGLAQCLGHISAR